MFSASGASMQYSTGALDVVYSGARDFLEKGGSLTIALQLLSLPSIQHLHSNHNISSSSSPAYGMMLHTPELHGNFFHHLISHALGMAHA
eukprot:8458206-Ditylum_brightwellii.AAC.1